jgi:hypothetical protein
MKLGPPPQSKGHLASLSEHDIEGLLTRDPICHLASTLHHPESDLPSIGEFTDPDILNQKPYLSDSVNFTFYSEASDK